MLLLREAAKKEAELSRRESDVQRIQSEIDTRERFANMMLGIVSLVLSALGLVPLFARWRRPAAAAAGAETSTAASKAPSSTQSPVKAGRRRTRKQRT